MPYKLQDALAKVSRSCSPNKQHVANNICGYFDLVSNMLLEIEHSPISGNICGYFEFVSNMLPETDGCMLPSVGASIH